MREKIIEERLKLFGGADFHIPIENIYTSAYVTGQFLKTQIEE